MKKFWRRFTGIFLAVIVSLPFPVLADTETNDEKDVQPRTIVSKTVTDSGKNRYSVSGDSSRTGKNALIYTTFKVSYYYGGTTTDKTRVNGYIKNITSKAQISLSGGGSNTLGGSSRRSGSDGSYSPAETYLYKVILVTTTHGFTCNGGSTSFRTSA